MNEEQHELYLVRKAAVYIETGNLILYKKKPSTYVGRSNVVEVYESKAYSLKALSCRSILRVLACC